MSSADHRPVRPFSSLGKAWTDQRSTRVPDPAETPSDRPSPSSDTTAPRGQYTGTELGRQAAGVICSRWSSPSEVMRRLAGYALIIAGAVVVVTALPLWFWLSVLGAAFVTLGWCLAGGCR